jgi:hypothetical protein
LDYEDFIDQSLVAVKFQLSSAKQPDVSGAYSKYTEHELLLNERFSRIKNDIRLALCDSIDIPKVMIHLADLMNEVKESLSGIETINQSMFNYPRECTDFKVPVY